MEHAAYKIYTLINLEWDLVTNGDLEYAVADAAVFLVNLRDTEIVASVDHEVGELVRSADGNTKFQRLYVLKIH